MHSSWLHVILIAQFFTVPFTESYGELVMVKYSPNITNQNYYQCLTTNDGSALTWNIEPDAVIPDLPRYSCIGVVLGLSNKCLLEKDVGGEFEEVPSIEYPMGPVFDYRWEAGDRYINVDFTFQKGFDEANSPCDFNVTNTKTIVFSVRTRKNFNVLFTGNNFTSSVPKVTFDVSKQCGATIGFGNLTNTPNHEPLLESSDDPIKWRTYIIKWNKGSEIEVFENGTTRNASHEFAESSLNISKIHFDISHGARLRVHWYRYFLTKKADTILKLDNLPKLTGQSFCIHLVISLCEECQFEVQIKHSRAEGIQKNFSRKGSTNSGLPFWQIETINLPLKINSTEPPIVTLITKTTRKDITDGRWAFGGMPYCISTKDSRYIVSNKSWHTDLIIEKMNDQKLPKVICEKLFYTENSLVHSKAKITSTVLEATARSITQTYSKFGWNHYKEMMVCDSSNCICTLGFMGSNCDQECPKGNYGYGCRDTCAYCFGKSCDAIMGKCNLNCIENRMFPYCKKLIQKPKIKSSSDTRVTLQFNDRLDKEEIRNFRIELKLQNGTSHQNSVPLRSSFAGNPPYTEKLLDLVPCTTYEVWYTSGKSENRTRGEGEKFTTKWNSPTNLDVKEQIFGCINLTWLHNSLSAKQPIFHVSYHQLSTTLKNQITLSSSRQHKDNQTAPMYSVQLCLLTASEYNLTITVMDDNFECGNASAAKKYHTPPNPSFGKAQLQVSCNDLDLIELTIPPVINDTNQSNISVVVMTKPNCSISNIRRYISKSANETGAEHLSVKISENGSIILIMKRNTEFCQLLPNESYDVIVTVCDGPRNNSLSGRIESLPTYLSLTIGILLTSVICAMFAYIVYLRYKVVRSKAESHTLDETIQTTRVPYESLYNHYARVEKLKAFEKDVKKSVENGVLLQQFRELPRGLVRPCKIGLLPKNRSKNRYGNFVAYDDTRVILGGGDDYINANYIHGYCKEKAYIATQAPIPETVDDFWRMIWQEEVTIICMLVDVGDGDKKMCEQYWPKNVKAKKDYGDFIICNMEERVYPNFTHRSLLMVTCYDEKSRMIEHLQFTEWTDEEVPVCPHSAIEYLNKLRSIHTRGEPIVVHCSTGAGRTGTIILCDISTRHIADKGTIDIAAEARKMFEARANMLSNYKQFVLTHLVATQYLLQPVTKIPYQEITREKIEQFKNDLPMLLSRLEDCSWMGKSMDCLDPVKPPANENILKNRFRKLTPVSPRLVILQRYPTHDIHSDYISAVSVDGVNGKQYITSQLPLPSTLTDFWRLIIEKNVRIIVILQRPDPENNDSCCDIVPRGTLIPIPNVTVNTESHSNANKFFTMDTLSLTNTSTVPVKKRKIIALTCENWSLDEDARPPKPEALMGLWLAVDRVWHRGPILVLCYDGVKGCGLYVAMSNMLDRMSSERECDVLSATRVVQRSRQEFMTAQWQFEYLYDVAVQHAEAFKTYANVI